MTLSVVSEHARRDLGQLCCRGSTPTGIAVTAARPWPRAIATLLLIFFVREHAA
ncbi:MAG: hypothetical protein R3A10_13980 [Caldilineaceae bacterium]